MWHFSIANTTTVNVPELDPSYKLDVNGSKLSFSGHSSPPQASGTASKVEPKTYEFELELFGEVEEVKRNLNGKALSLVLQKKEAKEDYWPRLTKEKVKLNWLKVSLGTRMQFFRPPKADTAPYSVTDRFLQVERSR